MYISDDGNSRVAKARPVRRRGRERKTSFLYLCAAIITALLAFIYEQFSHDVYSKYMIFAFAWPLLGGALPFWAISRARDFPRPGWMARCLYHSGVVTLAVGSFVTGVFEIYGSTSDFVPIYWYAGGALAVAGIIAYMIGNLRNT